MDTKLTADTTRPTGTRNSRRLRAEGKVPAVVYGLGQDTKQVSVEWPELRKALTTDAGMNALIDLDVDGEHHLSIVKDLQRHPVRRDVIHVDFLLIDRDAPLSVEVPVVLIGEADKVENEKGIVDQILYTLQINAKPDAIPNELELDISDLEIGSTLTVGDISLPPGVTTDLDADDPVATGSMTRSALVEETAVEGEEGAEGAEGEGAEGEGADGEGAEASEGGDEG